MKTYLKLILLLFLFPSCKTSKVQEVSIKTMPAVQDLVDHSKEFDEEKVIEVVDGVHVAVGFGLANSILIEGMHGNIIVDCMESNNTARNVKAAFDKISNKPVTAIIYTHYHPDHIFGAGVFMGDDSPEIYAHELTNHYIDRITSIVRPVVEKRSYRMFGTYLDEENHINCGIGPYLDGASNTERSLRRPTITFQDSLTVEIEGHTFKLAHVPGETDDQLYVWLPNKKVLLSGDNIYKSFPNLYTIRGTPYRDVKKWARSLDKMRTLEAEYLIPSHTMPLIGKDKIRQTLQDYADAIHYVHDQTIYFMNLGMEPDDIVKQVQLPQHLANSPYLQEFYGRVDWSVRNIYHGYLGWFNGNPAQLFPLSKKEKAKRMSSMLGGDLALVNEIKTAYNTKDYQWTLELIDLLKTINESAYLDVREIEYETLLVLGSQQSNPNARNYFLSSAKEVKGFTIPISNNDQPEILANLPISTIFDATTVNLNAEKSLDYNKIASFYFPDLDEHWTLHIRNGVASAEKYKNAEPDFMIESNSMVWKELVAEVRSATGAIAKGDLKIKGGLLEFNTFMSMFKPKKK